jgi:hypothetical protein
MVIVSLRSGKSTLKDCSSGSLGINALDTVYFVSYTCAMINFIAFLWQMFQK